MLSISIRPDRDVIWASWRLKSPPTPLFRKPFVHMNIKEDVKTALFALRDGNLLVPGGQFRVGMVVADVLAQI